MAKRSGYFRSQIHRMYAVRSRTSAAGFRSGSNMLLGAGIGATALGMPVLSAVTFGGSLLARGAAGLLDSYANRRVASAQRLERISKFRHSRESVAKGAAQRSGRLIDASNRSGGRRVASAAPAGSNGSVKGYYRQQGGKSVFVQGYSRA